jgi:hypothetical protein
LNAGSFNVLVVFVQKSFNEQGGPNSRHNNLSINITTKNFAANQNYLRSILALCRVPEECSEEVVSLIHRCCSADAKARPSALEIMHFIGAHLDSIQKS